MSHHNMKVAGIDTGKHSLTVCLLPGRITFEVSNDEEGHGELVASCIAHEVERAGIEATSIYHKKAARALRAAGIAVAELQPAQARAFAKALLKLAKNDDIDAYVLGRLTQVLESREVRPAPDQRLEELAEHLTFIDQLDARMSYLKTTLERYGDARITDRIKADLKALKAARRKETALIVRRVRAQPDLAMRFDLLLSIQAVGERSALVLLIRMPELGRLSREQAAHLAGVAPMDDDSAGRKGVRRIKGGRARVRKTLYMAALAGVYRWNPELARLYRRLTARGKPHKAAMIACVRKLIHYANAVLTRRSTWRKIEGGMPCLQT